MEFIDHFLWLITMTWHTIWHFWPVTGVLILLLAAAVIGRFRPGHEHPRAAVAVALWPVALPVLILACGTLFRHPPNTADAAPRWPQSLIMILFFANIPFGILLAWRKRKLVEVAAAAALLATWFCFWAAFIATMSITGDWL